MIRESTLTSMLPPEMTQTTFCSGSSVTPSFFCSRAAAAAGGPAPSATVFSRSIKSRIALAISSSSTGDQLVDVLLGRAAACARQRASTGDAVGEASVADGSVTEMAGVAAPPRIFGSAAKTLDADHAHARLERHLQAPPPCRRAQPPPPTEDDHHVGIGNLLEDLQRAGALPRDHRLVIEGVHKEIAVLRLEPPRLGIGIVIGRAVEDHVGAEGERRLDFDERRRLRHHDGGADAEPLRVDRDPLRVISGRGRDHPAQPRLRRQSRASTDSPRRASLKTSRSVWRDSPA